VNIRNRNGKNNDPDGDIPDGWGLMQWINNEIHADQPWKLTIAEDMQNNDWITKGTGEGGTGFSAQWDADFVHSIRNAIIPANDADRNMLAVPDTLYHRYNGDAMQRVVYTESHDEVANGKSRVPEEIWPGNAANWFSRKRSTLGAALVFTAPGIPMIFQGQEFLEDGYFHDQDPLDWKKLQDYGGINQLYRDLIRLRRNWYNGTRGLRGQHIHVYHVNNSDKVIAFHRWENGGPGDDVIVIANFANCTYDSYTIGMPRDGWWRVRFNSDWQGYSDDFHNQPGYNTTAGSGSVGTMPCRANVGIGPYSVLILSQDNP
jgi:1,4-alpha-glucan branching enzyme